MFSSRPAYPFDDRCNENVTLKMELQHNFKDLPDPRGRFPTWNKSVLVFYSEDQESVGVFPNYREKKNA